MPELMTSDKEPAAPQPTFPHTAYGVSVTWLGEDGGMAAQGHVPDLRFLAACNHMARKEIGLRNIWDDPAASLEDALGIVSRVWAVPVASRFSAGEWALRWGGVTEQTPGAFPLTVLWP